LDALKLNYIVLQVSDLIQITDNAYSRRQILGMEKAILNKMEWNLTVPTMYVFLVRFAKAAGNGDKEVTIYNLVRSSSSEILNDWIRCRMVFYSVHVDADGAYGVLLRRASADGVQHGDIPPLVCRSVCSVCLSLHPQEESSLDRHFEVPHWFRRAPA
jgi:hypothetical protein